MGGKQRAELLDALAMATLVDRAWEGVVDRAIERTLASVFQLISEGMTLTVRGDGLPQPILEVKTSRSIARLVSWN